MKNKSRKAKGRYLQNIVRDKILKLFPRMTRDDIRTSLMSENGADVKLLSQMARKLFAYSIECKNREDYKTIYNATDKYEGFVTHSEFAPYMSSVGLYNDDGELCAVGKLAKPIKLNQDATTTVVVRFDV